MKIKKGDTVKIMIGKDRGKTGKVLKVFSEINKITVEGMNKYKKHVRPRRQGEKGEAVEIMRPLALSNVQVVCPQCKAAVRVRYQVSSDAKQRMCRKCGASL